MKLEWNCWKNYPPHSEKFQVEVTQGKHTGWQRRTEGWNARGKWVEWNVLTGETRQAQVSLEKMATRPLSERTQLVTFEVLINKNAVSHPQRKAS